MYTDGFHVYYMGSNVGGWDPQTSLCFKQEKLT